MTDRATWFLTCEEAAAYLNVQPGFVLRRCREYRRGDKTAIPNRKFGRAVRIPRDDFETWAKGGKR